jgi:hypothetical protein
MVTGAAIAILRSSVNKNERKANIARMVERKLRNPSLAGRLLMHTSDLFMEEKN